MKRRSTELKRKQIDISKYHPEIYKFVAVLVNKYIALVAVIFRSASSSSMVANHCSDLNGEIIGDKYD